MSAKAFVFWAGVGIVTLAGSYIVIRWFIRNEERQIAERQKNEATKLEQAPRRETGFHAIVKDHVTEMA